MEIILLTNMLFFIMVKCVHYLLDAAIETTSPRIINVLGVASLFIIIAIIHGILVVEIVTKMTS